MRETDLHLLRAVAGQFLMGAMLGALFIGVLMAVDARGIMTMVSAATYPQVTMAIISAGSILYFAFGAAITGFIFLVSD